MTDPCDLSALEARRLIGRKALSPVELTESCIRRIEQVDGALNAITALDADAARKAAKKAEKAVTKGEPLGLLHGLPVGIKDLQATKGLRTTWGSLLFKDHVPEEDDPVVANVRAEGGIILAKTNMHELAVGINHLSRRGRVEVLADGRNHLVFAPNVREVVLIGRHDPAVLD